MTSPTSRFGLNRTTRETKSSHSLAKVYMRNFGKGLLELSDGKVKFYTEKGRLSKNKELSKEIPFADIESVTLDGKELTVTWMETARFVFEDLTLAEDIYAEVKSSIGQQPKGEKKEVIFDSSLKEDESKERIGEKQEDNPEIQSEKTKQEPPQIHSQELPAAKIQFEEQKPEECMPVELSNREEPKKSEIPTGQGQNNLQVFNTEAHKELQDFVERSVSTPEIKQKPTETSDVEEIVEDEKEEENLMIVEQPKVELSLQEKESCNSQEVPIEDLPQCNLDETLSLALSITDSLFDVLRSLHGRINWKFIHSSEKCSEKNYRAFSAKKMVEANLDFSLFSSAIATHNIENVSKEAFCLLEAFDKVFEKLPIIEVPDSSLSLNFKGAKVALQSYYVLSDLILAAVVEDEDVEEETNHLVKLLGNLSNIRRQAMNLDEIISLVSKIEEGHGREIDIAEVRRIFRNQLKIPAQVN